MAAGQRSGSQLRDAALDYHAINPGKIEVHGTVPLQGNADLELAYTPGVAEVSSLIARRPEAVYDYTIKGNLVAIVTDGSAVLGLGDVGPAAALPVMEGKALLLKRLAGVDAVPLCLDLRDTGAIVDAVVALRVAFGAVLVEDIAAPRCFDVVEALEQRLDIPVFQDDQQGTAVVTGAAVLNAVRLLGKDPSSLRIVINGAGAAGTAVAMMLHTLGFRRLLVCDSRGVLVPGRPEGMTPRKEWLARQTNPEGVRGQLPDILPGADIFIGLSTAGALRPEWVRSMAPEPVIMALANPEPEIDPGAARSAGARIVCTARSDHPNQINNALAFPGLLRGVLDARARRMTPRMFESAARALAGVLSASELAEESILPNLWDPRVVPAVAGAVAAAAAEDGVAPVACAPGSGNPGPR